MEPTDEMVRAFLNTKLTAPGDAEGYIIDMIDDAYGDDTLRVSMGLEPYAGVNKQLHAIVADETRYEIVKRGLREALAVMKQST